VVASDVCSLAPRSGEAAREIKSLIGASVDRLQTGSRHVADAGIAMSEIVAQVRKVTELIREISSSAARQRSGIGEVSQSASQMDRAPPAKCDAGSADRRDGPDTERAIAPRRPKPWRVSRSRLDSNLNRRPAKAALRIIQ